MMEDERISEISIARILPNTFKLRPLDKENVNELIKSIEANGLLQPIIVKPVEEECFRIVLGSHRFEAVKRLGWKRIPAIIKRVSDEEGFLMNVTENLLRNTHINPVAEARGYKSLISKKWTVHEIALKIGKSDSYVCNRIRMVDKLHPVIQRELSFPRGKFSMTVSHAEHLASLDNPKRQLELAKLISEKGLSVRSLEKLTRIESEMVPSVCVCLTCPHYATQLNRMRTFLLSDAGLLGNTILVRSALGEVNRRTRWPTISNA